MYKGLLLPVVFPGCHVTVAVRFNRNIPKPAPSGIRVGITTLTSERPERIEEAADVLRKGISQLATHFSRLATAQWYALPVVAQLPF